MIRVSMHFGRVSGSPGVSPELRRAALLAALLLAASWSVGRLTAAPPAGAGPGEGYSSYNSSGRKQLLFRRPGPKGKG
jgi:hypothetical protein